MHFFFAQLHLVAFECEADGIDAPRRNAHHRVDECGIVRQQLAAAGQLARPDHDDGRVGGRHHHLRPGISRRRVIGPGHSLSIERTRERIGDGVHHARDGRLVGDRPGEGHTQHGVVNTAQQYPIDEDRHALLQPRRQQGRRDP